MKKQLLIGLSIGICIGAAAQSQVKVVKQNTTFSQAGKIDNAAGSFFAVASHRTRAAKSTRSTENIPRNMFTSSWNAFGVILSETNALTANQATNTVLFTHRLSQDWMPTSANSGFIQSSFSINNGTTWDSLLQVQDPVNLCRYPTGTLFNPTGNTVVTGEFAVASGPITDGTNWQGNYFASTQLNNTNNMANIRLNTTAGVAHQHMARIEMSQCGNRVFCTGGLYTGDPAGATAVAQGYHGISINTGTYNGSTGFTWAVDSIVPAFKPDPTDGTAQSFSEAVSAWSQDGVTGYIIADGIDNAITTASQLGYQPMVWKTVNSGATWTQMAPGNFTAIPSINATLRPSTGGTKKAWYTMNSGFDAVVDANNNLHIVSVINSGASDAPDSLGYTYTIVANGSGQFIQYVFDTYTTTATGGWAAKLVDSLQCISANANSPFDDGAGNKVLVDARIQLSRSTDGTHLFYIWTDSDPTAIVGENALPDVKARGWNITTGLMTPTTTFSTDGINYFMFASNITLVNGSTYSIPVTNSDSRDGTGNGLNPFNHYYRTGVQFNESDFVGINEIASKGDLDISQNYPNPFRNITSIDVNLKDVSTVTLEVYNTVGQKMAAQVSEKLAAGTHVLTVDGTKFTPGMYYYTVKTATGTATGKMIVQ